LAQQPIIVRIVEPPQPSGLMDVVLGSLGLTGAIVLVAVISGFILAGVLVWIRSRSASPP
jgi:hypothetical protein